MPQKTMTVRLRCSLDNGKRQWGPGECAELPEQQARELLDMGLAEEVEQAEAAGKNMQAPAPEENRLALPASAPDSETPGKEAGKG